MPLRWKSILIKMSGEALAGPKGFGYHTPTMISIAQQVKQIQELGVRIGLTVGGGNIFRGSLAPEKIQRVTGDYMGMLATVMNGLALQNVFAESGIPAEVYSSIEMPSVAKRYVRHNALTSLAQNKVLIFSGGTGRPYFTTDTAAALTALEIGSDLLVKATDVDGIYSANPRKDASAKLYDRISYHDILQKELRVMDLTAITLIKDHDLPLVVMNIHKPGNLASLAVGETVGTFVSNF